MSYETISFICQMLAMVIFGAVMTGILVHVLRPKNKAHFEHASRIALRHDDETEIPHGH